MGKEIVFTFPLTFFPTGVNSIAMYTRHGTGFGTAYKVHRFAIEGCETLESTVCVRHLFLFVPS